MIPRIVLLFTACLLMPFADVILDDFENHFKDPAHQGHIAAAHMNTGLITNIQAGGYWYIFKDENGSQITNHSGVPVTAATVEKLVYGDGIMHCKLTTKTSTNKFPFAGIGIGLIGDGDSLAADLSTMTAIKMRVKGSSSAPQALRFRLETKDLMDAGYDWGHYGYPIDIQMSPTEYKEIIVPASMIFPEKYSEPWKLDWKWAQGAPAVYKFAFQVKDGNEAEFHLDYIVFVGVEYTAFGFTHTDPPGLPAPSTENLTRISTTPLFSGAGLRALPTGCSFTLLGERNATLSVHAPNGRLIKTLIHGTVPAGITTVNWDGRTKAGISAGRGNYIYSLKAGDIRESQLFTKPK